ncbi:MAG: Slp family lipoprotein [Nitrosomonadaceae bacterium]
MKPYLFLSCLLLGACTNMPQAMRDAPVVDIPYTQVSQNIDSHKDAPVRWGGVIIDVGNEENFSLVQALFYPLNNSSHPRLDKPKEGRFVIKSTGFLDPMIYAIGREITVVGTLNGDIERTVGKRIIRVPLILSIATHLWPKYYHNDYYGYGDYGGFGGYGYGPYFGYYGYPAYWGRYYRPYW